ncbi:MAG: SoxR reducing system RseC family protein [Candidatus Bipolaricaulia bacterium]
MRAQFEGIVRDVNRDRAVVRLLKGPERCTLEELGAGGTCEVDDLREPFTGTPKVFEIEAYNSLGARRGQRVRLEFPASRIVRGSLVLYVLPAASFLIGLGVGGALGAHGGATGDAVIGWQVMGGFALMGLALLGVKLYGRWTGKALPIIVEIVRPSPEKLARFRAELKQAQITRGEERWLNR